MYQLIHINTKTDEKVTTYHETSDDLRQYMQTVAPDKYEWQGVDFDYIKVIDHYWTNERFFIEAIDASKVTVTLYEDHPLALVQTADNKRFHLDANQRANFMKAANLRFVRCEPDCTDSAWSYIYE